jgi:hypothetical protein
MQRAGREPDWSRVAAAGRLLVEAFDPPTPTPAGVFVTPAAPASAPGPTRTALPATAEPTRTQPPPPTTTPRPPPTPTAPPTATAGPVEYVLTRQELDAELTRAIAAGGVPLRNPAIRLVPSDRVALTGQLPVAIFLVPVELEARLAIDDRGRVNVTTTRVGAVGAELPDGIAQTLGSQIDEQGTRAVRGALPPDARARSVRVEPERIVVELAPTT